MPKHEGVKVGLSLRELAESSDPPFDLDSWVARLQQSGAVEVYVASETPGGAFIEAATADAASGGRAAVFVQGRRVTASDEIEWPKGDDALRDSVERVVSMFQQFDKLARFRFAASDMRLVSHAAAALVDAEERSGPARAFARVIETGMVITYARPFLESNEAGLGRKWWPSDGEHRRLHDELLDLRHEYHAHAAHTPQRRLENTAAILGREGRPRFAESWTELAIHKLEKLVQLADELSATFASEADRLEVELFGPKE